MSLKAFVFECSTNTYLECIEKELFGSNVPWPLGIAKGDLCLLNHYEVGKVFALWMAQSDGGRKLVPRAWGGRFPFQVRVTMVSTGVIEVPVTTIEDCILSPTTGRFENVLEGDRVEGLIGALRGLTQIDGL